MKCQNKVLELREKKWENHEGNCTIKNFMICKTYSTPKSGFLRKMGWMEHVARMYTKCIYYTCNRNSEHRHRVRLNKTRAVSKAGSVSLFGWNSKMEEPDLVGPLGRASLKSLTLSCHFFSGLLNMYIPHQNSVSISSSIILHRIALRVQLITKHISLPNNPRWPVQTTKFLPT